MRKCKCIKESYWFLIDDSFDGQSKGGKFSFIEGEQYDFYIDNSWCKSYVVSHDMSSIGLDEKKFIEHFEIIN